MNTKYKLLLPHRIDGEMMDFYNLFSQGNRIPFGNRILEIDFSQCSFINNTAVAYLGGLVKLFELYGGKVNFKLPAPNSELYKFLSDNNFLAHCGYSIFPRNENVIPLRHDIDADEESYADYLKFNWLGNGWVNVSPGLRSAIISNIFEIYSNAFEHSQSLIGIISCGQYYPKPNLLNLTIIDFGIGIVENIRSFKNDTAIRAENAIKWAFKQGTSTKNDITPFRGLGLDTLKSFINLNSGKIEVYSNQGHAMIANGREIFTPFHGNFKGTLVSIGIKCDEHFYKLHTEA